jgi:hypothetical protein
MHECQISIFVVPRTSSSGKWRKGALSCSPEPNARAIDEATLPTPALLIVIIRTVQGRTTETAAIASVPTHEMIHVCTRFISVCTSNTAIVGYASVSSPHQWDPRSSICAFPLTRVPPACSAHMDGRVRNRLRVQAI